jgi:hypothetical protein
MRKHRSCSCSFASLNQNHSFPELHNEKRTKKTNKYTIKTILIAREKKKRKLELSLPLQLQTSFKSNIT